jgi:NAD(P)-dependent dehydrogenase (short-subunit alcohol dehydrogenase family)
MHDLSERVVLVTGAAGGIGSALARAFAAAGARLALVDRDQAGLAAVAEGLPGAIQVSLHPLDLADFPALDGLLADVIAAHGGLDILVNNAGLTVHGIFADHTAADLDRVLDVDLRAPVHLTRIALPHLRRAERAHVVLVSSMAGGLAFPFQSAYSTAKFGLRGFGAALRIELAAEGIGVTTVMPGTIATQLLANATSHDDATSTRLAAMMRRYGSNPDRAAAAVLRGIHRNRGTVRAGWDSHLVGFVGWLAPALLPALLRLAFRREMLGQVQKR